jgi:hypothetical protein
MDEIIIKQGQVVAVEGSGVWKDGDTGSMRIKVKLMQDKNADADDSPDEMVAFPLLPKSIQSIPKIGEGVFVFTSQLGDRNSQRYYIGPIWSQPQYYGFEPYKHGIGTANALTDSNQTDVLDSINTNPDSLGSFPGQTDVAILGKGGSDIMVRDPRAQGHEEIILRCGIRQEDEQHASIHKQGKINFNRTNPVYIQMMYAKGLMKANSSNLPTKYGKRGSITGADDEPHHDGAINIVADHINLISHNDTFRYSGIDAANQPNLIGRDTLNKCIGELHNMVYGDRLIEYLEVMREAIVEHNHHISGQKPDEVALQKMMRQDLTELISPTIRLS